MKWLTSLSCGHPFTPENLVRDGVKGGKQYWRCRECNIKRSAAHRAPVVELNRMLGVAIKHQKRAAAWNYLKNGTRL